MYRKEVKLRKVVVSLDDGIHEGQLEWTRERPVIHVNGDEYTENAEYRMEEAINPLSIHGQDTVELPQTVIVNLKPIRRVIRGYDIDPTDSKEFYPPSTLGWYGHHRRTGRPAIYFVQESNWGTRRWLTIIDYEDLGILFSSPIKYFEAAGLWEVEVIEKWLIEKSTWIQERQKELTIYFEELLSRPAPNWKELSELTRGAPIKNAKIGRDLRETLDSIMPEGLDDWIRLQIMAFLARILCSEPGLPKEDPIDMGYKFLPAYIFSNLMVRHLGNMLTDFPTPQYVRFVWIADEIAKKSGNYDMTFTNKFLNLVLSSTASMKISLAEEHAFEILDKIRELRIKAKTDVDAWLKRMKYAMSGVKVRGDINYKTLDLRRCVYLGRAYRWPHQHLSWFAELEEGKQFNTRFNMMLLPPRALLKVSRLISIETIDWTVRASNPRLLDSSGRWHVAWNRLLNTMNTDTSYAQLKREYGPGRSYADVISENEAKYLDFMNFGFTLSEVESRPEFQHISPIKWNVLRDNIHRFREHSLLYNLHLYDRSSNTIRYSQLLQGMMFILEGDAAGMLSLIRAMLHYTPSATPYLVEGFQRAYVMVRLVRDEEKLATLVDSAKSNGVKLKLFDIKDYENYSRNILHRLWVAEGRWNEDVTGLLSQSHHDPSRAG